MTSAIVSMGQERIQVHETLYGTAVHGLHASKISSILNIQIVLLPTDLSVPGSCSVHTWSYHSTNNHPLTPHLRHALYTAQEQNRPSTAPFPAPTSDGATSPEGSVPKLPRPPDPDPSTPLQIFKYFRSLLGYPSTVAIAS